MASENSYLVQGTTLTDNSIPCEELGINNVKQFKLCNPIQVGGCESVFFFFFFFFIFEENLTTLLIIWPAVSRGGFLLS